MEPKLVSLAEVEDGKVRELTPEARSLAEHVVSLLGPTVRGVIHYGSRAQGRFTSHDSPFDFFVVVDSYREAFRSLARSKTGGFPAGTATALARVLPPNAVSIRRPVDDSEQEAKCIVISLRHLRRECSARARDHFVAARLTQHVLLAASRDDRSARALLECLEQVRRHAFRWVRPSLPPRFDTADYCRTQLEVSFGSEIRPEGGDHAATLFEAQSEALVALHRPVLEGLAEAGALVCHEDGYGLARRPGVFGRARVTGYFAVSRVRTTLRLLKHPFLYDDWVGYLLDKIERSSGERIDLTDRERRRPLVYLWPRVFKYLRGRSRARGPR